MDSCHNIDYERRIAQAEASAKTAVDRVGSHKSEILLMLDSINANFTDFKTAMVGTIDTPGWTRRIESRIESMEKFIESQKNALISLGKIEARVESVEKFIEPQRNALNGLINMVYKGIMISGMGFVIYALMHTNVR